LTRCGLYPCDDARGTRTSSYLPGGLRADSSDKIASGITHDLPYTKFLSTSGVSTTRASVIVTTMDAPQVHFPCFTRGSSCVCDTEGPGQHSVCCTSHCSNSNARFAAAACASMLTWSIGASGAIVLPK